MEARKEWDEVRWPSIVAEAKRDNAVILFGDEVGFAQWGSLFFTWSPEGKQPLIKTCGKRGQMKVFGAIGFQNGRLHYKECEGKLTNQSYEKFLKYLLKCYKGRKIILIEDGAPYHNGRNLTTFKDANQDRIRVERLRSYSPDKNPIERLWKNIKRDGTHLKFFPTMDCLRETVIYTFEKYRQNRKLVVCVMRALIEEWGFQSAA
jgi:transposase